MIIYKILILGLLFAFISSTCTSIDPNMKSVDDCGKLDEKEKSEGKTHCCFAQVGKTKVCAAYSQEEYDEKKNSQGTTEVDGITYKYYCYVQYLKLGFLNLIFLFI